MATHNGSVEDPEQRIKAAINTKSAFPKAAAAKLPYILAEAMVNHKKMVHPPCNA